MSQCFNLFLVNYKLKNSRVQLSNIQCFNLSLVNYKQVVCSSQNGSRADFVGQTPYLGSKQILFINSTFPYLNLCVCAFTSTLSTPTIVMIRAFPAGFFIFFDSRYTSTTHESSGNCKLRVQVTFHSTQILNITLILRFYNLQFLRIKVRSVKKLVRSILGLNVQTTRYFWNTPHMINDWIKYTYRWDGI